MGHRWAVVLDNPQCWRSDFLAHHIQLEGIILPPSCTGSYPFESPVAVIIVALILEAAAATALLVRRLRPLPPRWDLAVGLVGRAAATGAVVLYPTVVTDVSGLLRCSTVSVSAQSLPTLDGGASVAQAGNVGVATVTLLSNNPFIVCWAGRYGRIAYLSRPVS